MMIMIIIRFIALYTTFMHKGEPKFDKSSKLHEINEAETARRARAPSPRAKS